MHKCYERRLPVLERDFACLAHGSASALCRNGWYRARYQEASNQISASRGQVAAPICLCSRCLYLCLCLCLGVQPRRSDMALTLQEKKSGAPGSCPAAASCT